MTIAKKIASARMFLKAGNQYAYAQALSAAIRCAASDRAAAAFRRAIIDDQMEHLFRGLGGPAPIAKL
jgi:hypothetical protein